MYLCGIRKYRTLYTFICPEFEKDDMVSFQFLIPQPPQRNSGVVVVYVSSHMWNGVETYLLLITLIKQRLNMVIFTVKLNSCLLLAINKLQSLYSVDW